MSARFSRWAAMDSLNTELRACRKCSGLHIDCETPYAPGYGDIHSSVVLVGQSLHAYNPETTIQIPFVGPAGKYDSGSLLREAISEVGIDYVDLFTTNAVHCHPSGNRASTANEMKHCRKFLEAELHIVRPNLIVCLGHSAQVQVRSLGIRVASTMGKVKSTHSRICKKRVRTVWIYHPAYLLRKGDKEETVKWKKNIGKILVEELRL